MPPGSAARVENGVGYIKKNFLNGLELSDFSVINPAASGREQDNVRPLGDARKPNCAPAPRQVCGAHRWAVRTVPFQGRVCEPGAVFAPKRPMSARRRPGDEDGKTRKRDGLHGYADTLYGITAR
jgi:hypothetical protein